MPISFDGKKGEFSECIAHFMGKMNQKTGMKHTKESASKMCGSMQEKQENMKEHSYKLSDVEFEFKEEQGEFYSKGFVATTHKDRAGDILSENVIKKIVDSINNKYGNPSAGSASDRHDWLKQQNANLPLAGRAVLAEVRKTKDGHLGAFVETHHHKLHPDFEKIKYNVEKAYYPGYSIELDNAKRVDTSEGKLVQDLDLIGYGFADSRFIANPYAEIVSFGYKEIVPIHAQILSKNEPEVDTMQEEVKETEKAATQIEVKETKPEVKEFPVSEKEYALLQKLKNDEAKKAQYKELVESDLFKEAVKTGYKEAMTKSAPLINKDGKAEFKEFDSYQTALAEMKELDKPMKNVDERESTFKRIVNKQYKEAARLYNALESKGIDPFRNGQFGKPAESKQISFDTYGPRIEMKEFWRLNSPEMKAGEGLQVDTNLANANWTYGSYYLSPVELNDIFQPVLVNQLNDQTVAFGRLKKVDFSGRSQIQFRARTGRNSTAAGYAEGANYTYASSFTGTVGRDKYQQPYSYYHVLVAVTGQEKRFAMAPGGMGDIWADEIKWAGQDLLVKLNQELIGTGVGTSESIMLGFEGLILGTTGTLYGKSLTDEATLRSHKENLSNVVVSIEQLRKMLRLVQTGTGTGASQIHSNAMQSDLVFFGNHLQKDFVKRILQTMQRIVPTSGRIGFEGEIEVDGVPFVADKDMNTDDIFLIDSAHTQIAMNLPPTLEPLPVTADAQAAHIKTYLNLYSDAPGNNYWAHTFATS